MAAPPDRTVSRTAVVTAFLRAAHQLFDAAPRVLDDPVAVPLLGPAGLRRLTETAEDYRSPGRAALRAHLVLRSRFAEDCLAAAVARGVRQYVILGAGFDTFALRQPAWAQALRILEVDQAATQGLKRTLIAAAGLALPPNAALATVDFAAESLRDGLLRHGLQPHLPTFFSWLGVTMYLPEDAIDAVLTSVASFPPGSEIVLTYAPPEGPVPSPLAERAARLNEPWLSCFAPEDLERKLRRAGLAGVEFLSPAEATARYFRDRPDDLPHPARTNIVRATC